VCFQAHVPQTSEYRRTLMLIGCIVPGSLGASQP
jgi:hypothetical protein